MHACIQSDQGSLLTLSEEWNACTALSQNGEVLECSNYFFSHFILQESVLIQRWVSRSFRLRSHWCMLSVCSKEASCWTQAELLIHSRGMGFSAGVVSKVTMDKLSNFVSTTKLIVSGTHLSWPHSLCHRKNKTTGLMQLHIKHLAGEFLVIKSVNEYFNTMNKYFDANNRSNDCLKILHTVFLKYFFGKKYAPKFILMRRGAVNASVKPDSNNCLPAVQWDICF